MFKSRISLSVSAKKVYKKISCLCTFNEGFDMRDAVILSLCCNSEQGGAQLLASPTGGGDILSKAAALIFSLLVFLSSGKFEW